MPQSSISVDPLLLITLCVILLLTGCALRKNTTTSAPPSQAIDVLLIAYDNGDGRAFRSLLPELDEKNINWHLIAFGPATALFKNTPNTTLLNASASPEQLREWQNNRYTTLPEKDAALLTEKLSPQIVLSGMAHSIQAQLVQQWWQQGAWTIAFYDNMEPPGGQNWVKPWLDYNPTVEQLLVTTNLVKRSFPDKTTRSGEVSLVYHPALQEWQETFEREDRQLLAQSLNLDDRPVVLVAGGYGDDFQRSLEVITSAAALREDLQWVFTPHPRTLISPVTTNNDHTPLRTITNTPTVRVATLAQVVVSHRSTVGWMSAQIGIPVIFVRPKEQADIIERGRVRTVDDETTFLNALHRQLDNPPEHIPQPEKKAGSSIADLLERRLREQKPSSIKVESVNDIQL
ncbi:hypothetical protein [Parendozoicomonas sp. Alg238-R29]|uniref:hypothetical protein n=1 Tax=Parendozoicomonas sp. Alg238-R29 TaxID=2993446 RepID=UPI00248E9B89|nr:hypothetical protein [Parendozoicomonas sp. Alg238-R29]